MKEIRYRINIPNDNIYTENHELEIHFQPFETLICLILVRDP